MAQQLFEHTVPRSGPGTTQTVSRFDFADGEADVMGFFDGASGGDREPVDAGALEFTGVPQVAADRLQALESHGMFSGTLSANEFALLTDLGPQPLAQVMGASVYQVGWQYLHPDAQWGGSDFHARLDRVNQA
jgi:hypothetical protein